MSQVKKIDPHETKIPCAGCRKEMEAEKLCYDSVSAEVICKICSCNYATCAQQPFEMEEE
jgi:hypothetical protein